MTIAKLALLGNVQKKDRIVKTICNIESIAKLGTNNEFISLGRGAGNIGLIKYALIFILLSETKEGINMHNSFSLS